MILRKTLFVLNLILLGASLGVTIWAMQVCSGKRWLPSMAVAIAPYFALKGVSG